MKDELSKKLNATCPNLYKNFWFEIDDGWFQIVFDLSVKLEQLILDIPEPERAEYKACQVKQKFGGLRFYMDSSPTPEMNKLISEAERLSFKTCEVCGEIGTRRPGGWIWTLCDSHAKAV